MSDTERLEQLRSDLVALARKVRDEARSSFGRFNPFFEDLTDWRQRGRDWAGEDRGISLYESAILIGDVEIGDGTWVGPFCLLDGSGGLSVGHHCSISTGAQLLSHDTIEWALSGGVAPYRRSPTTIGDCCFIGTHAVVTRGVTIGDRSVVAAGAVVSDDVPAGSIVGGVPARRIGRVEVDAEGGVLLHYGSGDAAL